MTSIAVTDVIVPSTQRRLRPWKVAHIAAKMRQVGFNESYPITLEADGRTLVDGGHRLAAAREAGIEHVPYIVTKADPIAHAIRTNEDGTDTEAHDVFDLAELCWQLSKSGETGADIAPRLGWTSPSMVTFHKNIKERLHPWAFELAAAGFTRNEDSVNWAEEGLVNPEFTKVNWSESHLREIVSAIPYTDRASYRAQMCVIRAALARFAGDDSRDGNPKRVTARWVAEAAAKCGWHACLARYMRDHVVERVPLRDRIALLHSVYQGVYGNKQDDRDLEKFVKAVALLNEQALRIRLYHDDAMRRIPQLEDGSIALVVTDPPYNVTDHEWDRVGTDDEYLEFLRSWLETLRPKLARDYHLFLFCDPAYQARIEGMLTTAGWPLLSRIIWWNRSIPPGRVIKERFAQTWQMVFHCGTHALNWPPEWTGDDRFDVQVCAAPNSSTAGGGWHPTPKPEELLKKFISLGSKPTDMVLDPFAGGGATGAACVSVGQRQCILIEREEGFCANIERRLEIKRSE